mmetsp:Transcript_54316/g.117543  ORF Transcript_54316/g.117543 Transcript_54316/m.117543 type:complete len:576 (-) Transcript_54316:130-1857(-)
MRAASPGPPWALPATAPATTATVPVQGPFPTVAGRSPGPCSLGFGRASVGNAGSVRLQVPPTGMAGYSRAVTVSPPPSPAMFSAAGTSSTVIRPGCTQPASSPSRAELSPRKGEQILCLSTGRELNSVALSPDARLVALGLQDHSVQIWDLEAGVRLALLRGHKNLVNHVAYSLDGTHVASASSDKTIKFWNVARSQCEATFQGHLLAIAEVAFSDDALKLASASWDKTVRVWDLERCRSLLTLSGHTDWVHSVAWAPGARQLASASSDHSVRVWNAISGIVEQVLVGHVQTVSSVSYAPNGIFLASGSLDRTVRVWNVQEGALSARLHQETEEGAVHCVAFAPDNERIVVGCSNKTVKVWNFHTGRQIAKLFGHEDAVLSVCVFPDGMRAVSCSHDETVRVWQLPRGRRKSPNLASKLGSGSDRAGRTVATSLRDLHERLRSTEDTNQRLRRELSEAQMKMEEKNRRMQKSATSLGEQERQITNYRDLISNLTAEKDHLERSFAEMRRELQQMPSVPAGSGTASNSRAVRQGRGRGTPSSPVMRTPFVTAGAPGYVDAGIRYGVPRGRFPGPPR